MKAMLALVPLSLLLEYVLHAPPLWVFLTAALAIVPLADWVRRGTEQVAKRAGPAVGSLLNVSFGNAPELILALFILLAGEFGVVKAQITGSIIGNGLLGTGLAIVAGCWNRDRLCFNRERAGLLGSLLILSMIGLLIPALFHYTERDIYQISGTGRLDEDLSLAASVVLILVYLANLIYTFCTHRDVFNPAPEVPPEGEGTPGGRQQVPSGETQAAPDTKRNSSQGGEGAEASGSGGPSESSAAWPLWVSILVLLISTSATALQADLVSGALSAASGSLGLTKFFLGVIVLAIVGNAAEYVAAVYFALQGRIGMALSITVGSTIQVALLGAPLLVITSYLLGRPMNLVFANPLELIAIAGVAFVVNSIAQDGETTWFEGVMLLAVYLLLGFAFYFVRQ